MTAGDSATVGERLQAAGCPVNPGKALVRAGLRRRLADRLLATPIAPGPRVAAVDRLGELLARQAAGGLAATAEETLALATELLREPERVTVSLSGPAWLDPSPWLPPDGQLAPAEARRVHHLLHGRHVAGQPLAVRCEPPLRMGPRPPRRAPQDLRRKRLFSRWHEGVRWDEEGLYSATPEALADELVRGARGLALDAGCGLGALSLALARQPGVTGVVAVERDPERLACARHNAAVYGVADRIRFVLGDATEVASQEPCDVLVADPPWGGRDYDRRALDARSLGLDLAALLDHAPADTRLKLPPSILPETLPGAWTWRAAVDADGVLKFLVATRA